MSQRRPVTGQAELLMTNARLRDELEPYRDESIDVSTTRMPLAAENEYLASILAWERAPALPIAQWFDPPISLPPSHTLDDDSLKVLLSETIKRLASRHVVLQQTDHLSDRELYRVIVLDILPTCEKCVAIPGNDLQWQCVEDTDTYLRYYADAVERRRYQEEHQCDLPPSEPPPYPRTLPTGP